uniref:RxLR effector protein n=1 Tax=Phytophthora ramorum TaxID=164328 RepID=H3GN90_PHYRM
MRLQCILLLIAAALASADAAVPADMNSNMAMPYLPTSLATGKNSVSPKRLLRTVDYEEEEDDSEEERGILSGLESITGTVKTKILNAKLRSWLKKGQTTDDVFARFKLNNGVDDVLSNPKLKTWVTYVEMFNKQNPENKVSMTSTLTKTYGEAAVARVLDAGTKVASTETIAKRLQAELLRGWLSKGDSVDDVLKLLKLNKGVQNLVADQNMQTLATYAITASYGDDAVARGLAEAAKVSKTESSALELQGAQFNQWMTQKLDPEDIYASVFKIGASSASAMEKSIVTEYSKFVKAMEA